MNVWVGSFGNEKTALHRLNGEFTSSVSPDLNPIENVWAAMKSDLRERPVAGSSNELFALLIEVWDSLDAFLAISSMRMRLVATIDAEGGHTKY